MVAELSTKREIRLLWIERNILKSDDVLAEWHKALEIGAVSRPSTVGSKRHCEKRNMSCRHALHKFKDEHNMP